MRRRSQIPGWAELPLAAVSVATVVGFFVYWYLLDPVTYVSHNATMFKWVSASIPSLISAGVVYAVLTALVIKPLRKGGYELAPAVVPTRAPKVAASCSRVGPGFEWA